MPLTVGLLLAVGLFLLVDHVGPMPGDRWALEHWPLRPERPEPWASMARFFSSIGTPLFALVALALVLRFVGSSLGRPAAWFVVLGMAGVVVCDVLKVVLGPSALFVETYGAGRGGNYPSGHVVYAVGAAGALGVLAWERGRRDAALVAAAVVVLMGVSRAIDGAHLVSDVVGGYLVGAGWLVFAMRLCGRGPWRGRAAISAAAPPSDPTARRPVGP